MKKYSWMLVCVLLFAGCAGHVDGGEDAAADGPTLAWTPTATPTVTATAPESASPTPTAAPTPAATSVVISTTGLKVMAADGSASVIHYSDSPESAIAALTEAFGSAPEVSTHESAGDCDPSYQDFGWGEFAVQVDYSFLPEGARFQAVAKAPDANNVALSGSDGTSVGDDVSGRIAKGPVVEHFTADDGSDIAYIAVKPKSAAGSSYGEELYTVNGTAKFIASPVVYEASGAC